MQLLDNITATIKDDWKVWIRKDSKLSIAAACFSIYAYQELKKQLTGIRELRFIFTSPTFVTEKASKAQREFYIPRLSRERSIYGTEFEVRLRNELTWHRRQSQRCVRIGLGRRSRSNPMPRRSRWWVSWPWTKALICRSMDLRRWIWVASVEIMPITLCRKLKALRTPDTFWSCSISSGMIKADFRMWSILS